MTSGARRAVTSAGGWTTDAELLTYSCEHLHYECWMLEETASRLLHAPLHLDRDTKNMAVECFTIHARVLTTFLYPEASQQRPTDVSADDYMPDPPRWRDLRGDMPSALLTVIRRTGGEIAHLKTRRLNYDARTASGPPR